MYVFINGAFGVGKSSVARALRSELGAAVIFDPEHVGFVLQRLPGYARSDFQHLPMWRRLCVVGARAAGIFWPTVIVPMAFSHRPYLEELLRGLGRVEGSGHGGRAVHHFCLTAPLEVVRERLAGRGEPFGDPRWAWVHRRTEECCRAHSARDFAIHVPTEGFSPEQIAQQISLQLRTPNVD